LVAICLFSLFADCQRFCNKFIAVEECIDSHFIGVKEKTNRRWKRGPQSLNTESRIKLRIPENRKDGFGKSVADAEAHHFLQLASARSAQPTRAGEIVRKNMTVILAVEAKAACMNQCFNDVALREGTTLVVPQEPKGMAGFGAEPGLPCPVES
jgi:hypothetical protein